MSILVESANGELPLNNNPHEPNNVRLLLIHTFNLLTVTG